MILGQVVPIPHNVFVIAFIQTKQRKQTENQQSLCTPSQDVPSCNVQGRFCQVCEDMSSVVMDEYTHYNWLLLSFTSPFISDSIFSSLSFSASLFFSSLLRGPHFPL